MTLPEWWVSLFRCSADHLWFAVLAENPGGRWLQSVCQECERSRPLRGKVRTAADLELPTMKIYKAPLRHWRGVEVDE